VPPAFLSRVIGPNPTTVNPNPNLPKHIPKAGDQPVDKAGALTRETQLYRQVQLSD